MKHRIILNTATILTLLLILVTSGCSTPKNTPTPTAPTTPASTLKGTISASGAFALYPMMTVWADEFKKLNPGVNFDISAGGAGKGMTDALAGAVDIGMVSRDITKDEQAKGAAWVGVVKDAVFPIVNAKNPILADIMSKGITKSIYTDIFITGKITTWGQVVGRPEVTDAIHVYTRSDSAGAADAWAKYLGNKTQADLKGVGVNGDPGLTAAVVNDPLGIGYNNLAYAFDPSSGQVVTGITVIPLDSNANGIADPDEIVGSKAKAIELVANGKYPSPPARVLNLVTKGKPSGLVQSFLQWVLTDGQKFVSQAGYVALPQDQLDANLQKIQ